MLASITELQAVNIMLDSIGEAPVNELVENATDDAGTAQRLLENEAAFLCQDSLWNWNTDEDWTLTPDVGDSFIYLPTNTCRFQMDPSERRDDIDVVQRGNRLYDRTSHSFLFTETVLAIISVYLEFEDLHPAAKTYITMKAARKFQQRQLGSNENSRFTAQDELDARITLDSTTMDILNITIFDNTASQDVLFRDAVPRR